MERKIETFTVTGMTCHHCEMAVEKAAKSLSGVADAKADRTNNSLTLTTEAAIDKSVLQTAVSEAGYTLT